MHELLAQLLGLEPGWEGILWYNEEVISIIELGGVLNG